MTLTVIYGREAADIRLDVVPRAGEQVFCPDGRRRIVKTVMHNHAAMPTTIVHGHPLEEVDL